MITVEHRTMTQEELVTEGIRRFGSPPDIAFQCPACGDVAAVREFADGGGRPGQECIGRSLGALRQHGKGEHRWEGRGCDWTACGLIPGPWVIIVPGGREVRSFPLADAP
jgi:hypothetical protein